MESKDHKGLLRMVLGGEKSVQDPFLKAAMAHTAITDKYIFQILTPKDIRERRLTPEAIMDWVTDSKVKAHIFATHFHQSHPFMDCRILKFEYEKLRNHLGFPTGDEIGCPAFTQDKWDYYGALPEYVLPTIRVLLPPPSRVFEGNKHGRDHFQAEFDIPANYFEQIEDLQEFIQSGYNEGLGWIIKLPFSTNALGRAFCPTAETLYKKLYSTALNHGHRVPYALVQPTIKNRHEKKVILLNGEAKYVTSELKKVNMLLSFSSRV